MAGALARAFAGDPPMQWFVPGAARRERLLPGYFASVLPLHLRMGEVWTSEDPAGAAAWVAPGRWPFPPRAQAGVLGSLLRTFGRHPVRSLRGVAAIEAGHPHEPHWYLDYIGVDPAGHGRGTGSALLEPMLSRCDAERASAYLNAGSPRSRDLYSRHGFEVLARFELPGGGPPLWRMWRNPR
jgi:ribosomal protein S18 acetylase RimI-like enzyme